MTDDVQCLECGKRMQFLGTHIRRVHDLTAKQYREAHDLSASTPLASVSFCEQARRRTNERIALGLMNYDHLPLARDNARDAGRGYIATSIRKRRSETAAKVAPGATNQLPPGAKRADGRDADRARIAQQRRRSRISDHK